ncbi:uncharacterized protein YdiU (UPF0061 family) [Paenibacillus phyllosphaerae]|uniref:Protein nucleotidyltransferase YdiU n=1 Tax=Paenibacillus phyllosphaerae TaxID=274593 RepID=A0A7W5FNV7_9BACL|nr:YdiU family protein [Paenibacillus phyllosphaerae]MBB3111583.1 uncharacterized protein YdiU (UPF0061 family) [Paenibacillus phyllosphaerae]
MTDHPSLIEPGWQFDNSYAKLPQMLYSSLSPTAVHAPQLVAFNAPLAVSLGLQPSVLDGEDGAAVFAGNVVPEGAEPLAQAYAGHQFGHFTMLGDGRAILLGEQITPEGKRYDIQLKGAGRTPFSRGGDGRAALGPMLREYIISEAMHALGIPTTRSLAVVSTGEPVYRESELPGAVLTRVAASHIRVGTFQFVSASQRYPELQALADYTLERHYPEALAADNRYLALLQEVIKRQASLIAHWQLAGFVHGVMNTDNMAISGETIDYGPCAFLDTFDPATVFSSIDSQGRYAYGNQPRIAAWNLTRFAEALLPLIDEDSEQAVKLAEQELPRFIDLYHEHWLSGMRAKLGLISEEEQDEQLIEELLALMQKHRADYTNTFRALTLGTQEASDLFGAEEFAQWQELWTARLERQPATRAEAQALMRSSNPAVIPRNHRVEEALAAAVDEGDFGVMERLLQALKEPYAYSPGQEAYAAAPEPSSCRYRTYCGT